LSSSLLLVSVVIMESLWVIVASVEASSYGLSYACELVKWLDSQEKTNKSYCVMNLTNWKGVSLLQ
jgi:hypothetical protein